MRLLLDTNVVLDVLLERQPHVFDSAKLVAAVELGRVDGALCATTITTIHYLASKAIGKNAAGHQIEILLSLFQIAPVTGSILSEALRGKWNDYEDAVLVGSARAIGMEGIVTRNPADFSKSPIPIYSPADIVILLGL